MRIRRFDKSARLRSRGHLLLLNFFDNSQKALSKGAVCVVFYIHKKPLRRRFATTENITDKRKRGLQMAEYLSPDAYDAYIDECDSSVSLPDGVDTSVAGFVGMTQRGKTAGAPVLITGYNEFVLAYGDYLSERTHGAYRYLPASVEHFFMSGGTKCYISRVVPEDAVAAEAKAGLLHIQAADVGAYGNNIVLHIEPMINRKVQLIEKVSELAYKAKLALGLEVGCVVKTGGEYNRIEAISNGQIIFARPFKEEVTDNDFFPKKLLYPAEMRIRIRYNTEEEVYENVNLNAASVNYIGTRLKKSALIKLQVAPFTEICEPAEAIIEGGVGEITLSGGSDGSMERVTAATFIGEDKGPGKRTGIQAFLDNTAVSILAVPGITMPEVIAALTAHCEKLRNRFAVIDMPYEANDVKALGEYRKIVDSTYAAMYHPWIRACDRSDHFKSAYFPSSGTVAGVYARTDTTKGVHKPPANEIVSGTGLSFGFSQEQQNFLNSIGVNPIRCIPGSGIRIWGARTAGSDAAFKYVNTRRLFIYVAESIKANLSWVAFEQNDQTLWTRVNASLSAFLRALWENKMLVGATPEESYFIEIGTTTMTQDDIRSGRLICDVGLALSRPAEFVMLRVTQRTAEAEEQPNAMV